MGFDNTRRQLVTRGCTEQEAAHALSLLLQIGVPPTQIERWVNDLWSLVEAALDEVQEE